MKEIIKKTLAVVFGELLCALAITYFFIPHKLLSGGVGGIAILLQYLTNYSTGIFIILINIPLFIIGFKKLSKQFMFYTFFSTIMLSVFLMVLNKMGSNFYINDILLSSVFGGVINGTGMGILFRNSASQGGLDIVAIICRKERNMNISTVLMGINLVIVTIAAFIFGLEKGMYTIMSMFIGYRFVDRVVSGFGSKKEVIIISDQSEAIAQKILIDPHRGVTLLKARGAYTGRVKEIIYCVAEGRQITRIKEVVNEIDEKAFISISDMTEVKGKGFIQADIG